MGQLKRKSLILDTQFSRTTKSMRMTIPSPTIESLPKDLLIEIIAKAAANSFTDLFNLKLATKKLLNASEDGQIYRHVSLQNFSKTAWKNTAKSQSFIDICSHNNNPEGLYIKGMLDFFTNCMQDSGISKLKASAQRNNLEACYVYGVILFSTNSKDEGLKFLKMCEDKSGVRMVECRRRVKEFASSIWINNLIFSLEKNSNDWRGDCVNKNNCRSNERINGWDWNDEDNCYGEHTCESCKWNGEVFRFWNMLKTGRYY